jgi:PhzF family phenazine biosynthesis protein
MPNHHFVQLDVFTEQAFAGNPLAVFAEADGISDELMMKIAREMNLSETVFVLKPDSDEVLRRLRIFTPTREIPFAGHPIVGTWMRSRAKESFPFRRMAAVGSAFFTKSESECCRSILNLKTVSRSRS